MRKFFPNLNFWFCHLIEQHTRIVTKFIFMNNLWNLTCEFYCIINWFFGEFHFKIYTKKNNFFEILCLILFVFFLFFYSSCFHTNIHTTAYIIYIFYSRWLLSLSKLLNLVNRVNDSFLFVVSHSFWFCLWIPVDSIYFVILHGRSLN